MGDFVTAGDHTNANHLAKWDGKQWSTIGTGVTGFPWWEGEYASPTVRALALREQELFVAGRFECADPGGQELTAYNIAKPTWSEDVQQWVWADLDMGLYETLEGYVGAWVESLDIREGDSPAAYDLLAAGHFWAAGSGELTSMAIARWSVGAAADLRCAKSVHHRARCVRLLYGS